MTKKKNKRKSRNLIQGFIITALVISAIMYVLSFFWTKFNTALIRTSIVQMGIIEKSVSKDGVIIRNQAPVIVELDGHATSMYDAGRRVAKNEIIAKVDSLDSQDNEVERLEMISRKIDQMRAGNESVTVEYTTEYIDAKLDLIIRNIQGNIQDEDFQKISKSKAKLREWIGRKKLVKGIGDINNSTLEQLEEEKRILQNSIRNNKGYIRTSMAGLVLPYKDEYDDIYTFDNIMNLTAKQLKNTKQNIQYIDPNNLKTGDVICYIVDNHMYYIACELNSEDTQIIKRDKQLIIRIDGVDLPAYFFDFYKDKDGRFVGLFSVESDEYKFLVNRKRPIDIIYQSETGMLIPRESIIQRQGKTGVFVVDTVGIARFKEVNNIITSNEKYSLIYFDYDKINNEDTINLYDEVILTTEGIEEGRKIR